MDGQHGRHKARAPIGGGNHDTARRPGLNFARLKGKLAVLVVDSRLENAQSYKPHFQQLFEEAGYTADVDARSSKDLPADYFETRYVDVFICDVSLGQKTADKRGLEALDACRRVFPGIYTVAYTAHDLTYHDISGRHEFDLFIPKSALSNQENRRHVVASLRRTLKVNTAGFISAESESKLPSFTPAELMDLNRIVRKLTYTGLRNAATSRVSCIDLSPVAGGFSGSVVLRMQSYTEDGFGCVQALLKVARKSTTEAWELLDAEHHKYNEYVRWYLPYYWRPELLGVECEGSVRAICYAFASAREDNFRTLSTAIRDGDLDSVQIAMNSIFPPKFQRWYNGKNVREETELCDFYLRACFGKGGSVMAQKTAFGNVVSNLPDIDGLYLMIGAERFRWPHLALLAPPSPVYHSCIIHGDLNTRNILVSRAREAREVTLIDFSSTGRGHVFFDFIAFEANLRLDLSRKIGGGTLQRHVERERAINAGTGSNAFLNQTVSTLRSFAFGNFPDEDRNNYLLGLATYCYGLIGAGNLSDKDRRILAACTCAAMIDLEHKQFWE